jgi:hypothetical protein
MEIACTLTGADLPARVAEWQEFYRTSVSEMEHVSPSVVRLKLHATDAGLLSAASLAQREKECCAFFEFAIVLDPDERWLTVTVPASAEAAAVLDAFTAMLSSS